MDEIQTGTVVMTSDGIWGWVVPLENSWSEQCVYANGTHYALDLPPWQIVATPAESARFFIGAHTLPARPTTPRWLTAACALAAVALALALALDAVARWGG